MEKLEQIREEFEVRLKDVEESLARKLVDLNNRSTELKQKHGFVNSLKSLICNGKIWINHRRYEKRSHLLKVERAYYEMAEDESSAFFTTSCARKCHGIQTHAHQTFFHSMLGSIFFVRAYDPNMTGFLLRILYVCVRVCLFRCGLTFPVLVRWKSIAPTYSKTEGTHSESDSQMSMEPRKRQSHLSLVIRSKLDSRGCAPRKGPPEFLAK